MIKLIALVVTILILVILLYDIMILVYSPETFEKGPIRWFTAILTLGLLLTGQAVYYFIDKSRENSALINAE